MRPMIGGAVLAGLAVAGAAVASVTTLAWDGAFPPPDAAGFNAVLAEARGWSAVTLGLAVPAGALALSQRDALRGRLVLAGVSAYLAYTYLEMAVSPPFTALYLVYVATFACAIAALIAVVGSFDARESDRTPRRAAAVFSLLTAAGLTLAWTRGIVASTVAGEFGWPTGVAAVGHVVHALDLGLVVPLALASGGLLLARRQVAPRVAAVFLGFAAPMSAALVAMVGTSALVAGTSLLVTAPFVVVWVVATALAAWFLGTLVEPAV